jgi:glutathionyl-hydroquinone reductase
MGMLIDGQWSDADPKAQVGKDGAFLRPQSAFREWITRDGSSGYPAEAGRYHVYTAFNCPWAHRVLIYLAIKGLEGAIGVSHAIPSIRTEGWHFGRDPNYPDCLPDTVNGFTVLHQAYTATDPHYTGKVTVPTVWDKKTRRVINNESSEIIRMLNSEFVGVAGNDTDFYPAALRGEIDKMNDFTYANINNGVYRAGFATSQEAYDAAYDKVFAALDELEARLGRQRYLVGHQITEADWRLFPTLVRFDVAYFSAFKCNRQRIADYPNLSNYMRELYQAPGIAATVKPRYYVVGYYSSRKANPNGIIPKGTPVSFAFDAPHDRASLAA